MFFTLLLATFVVAALCSAIVVRAFDKPIKAILGRIIQDPISDAWARYITFAAFVTGVSGGVRIYALERYIEQPAKTPEGAQALVLSAERWTLEIYRCVIETLQSIAWMYLLVFLIALIAYVIVKYGERRGRGRDAGEP